MFHAVCNMSFKLPAQVSSDPESVNVYGATAQLSHYVEQDTNRPGQDGMSAGNLNCSLEVLDELVQMSSGQSDIRNYEEQMEVFVTSKSTDEWELNIKSAFLCNAYAVFYNVQYSQVLVLEYMKN